MSITLKKPDKPKPPDPESQALSDTHPQREDGGDRNYSILGTGIVAKERRWEERGLFCFARCLSLMHPGFRLDQNAFDQKVGPRLDSSGTPKPEDAPIAFALIGQMLSPHGGQCRHLPQFDPLWLAFRRLFLELVASDNPSRPEFSDEDERNARPLRFRQGSDDSDPPVPVDADDPVAGLGNPFLEWRQTFEPSLAKLQLLVTERLDAYSRLSIAAAKTHLVERGEFFLGPECGFLDDIVNEFMTLERPVWIRRTESDPDDIETTEKFLRRMVVEERVVSMDFDEELRKAQRSVRAFLFDLAIERIVRSHGFGSKNVRELQEEALRRRWLDNPYLILNEPRVAEFVADRIAFDGLSFANSLVNYLKNLTHKPDQLHQRGRWEVKCLLAQLWTDPDFPLWLMRHKAITQVLKARLPHHLAATVTDASLRENWKAQSAKPGQAVLKSPLVRASKELIHDVQAGQVEAGSGGSGGSGGKKCPLQLAFPSNIAQGVSFQMLVTHIKGIGIELAQKKERSRSASLVRVKSSAKSPIRREAPIG